MKATFRLFPSGIFGKQKAYEQACSFATELGPKRLINISHSHGEGVKFAIVWYWSEDVTDSAEKHNW